MASDLTNKTWKTTNNPNGPTGYKRAGTFRDVSLVHFVPDFIDDMDYVCLEKGLKRSEVMELLKRNKTIEPLELLPIIGS